MNKNYYFVILLLNCHFFLHSKQVGNELQKVFHHSFVANNESLPSEIQLGKIVLYFSQEPVLKKVKPETSVNNGSTEIIFFVPHAVIASDQVKQMMNGLHKNAKIGYTASIHHVKNPDGVKIKISYDPKKILFNYDRFQAIKGEPSIEFHFYNKQLLETLKKKGQSILTTAYNGKPTIIIDCGHGGHDTGTVGFYKTCEKDITLAIGKQLSDQLQARGFPVLLTRIDDRFIPLDMRTLIANQSCNKSILISLHANSAPNKSVQGLETFCLDAHLFKKEESPIETAIDVMIDQVYSKQYEQSKKLAQLVHPTILQALQRNGYNVPDRHIRQKAIQVLMGIKWPGILIEMNYLSSLESELLLLNPAYQKAMVDGMCQGLEKYTQISV